MNYELILCYNGDIEIIEINFFGDRRLISHKTYSLGDDLQFNLLFMFNVWNNLKNKSDK